jgi:hypothetical protein
MGGGHVHVHAPHELTEAPEPRSGRPARTERRLELAAVLVLALTTLFRAWIAQRPFTNPRAIPGPLYVPQYRSADLERSVRLDDVADELYKEGTEAKGNDDRYILSTVFFAAVLFFAGISLRLDWRPLRMGVLGMALAALAGGAGFVLTLPVAS